MVGFLVAGALVGHDRLLDRGDRQWLCTGAASICIVSCVVSMFSVGCIGINRYFYICYHSKYAAVFSRCNIVVMVIATWVAGVAIDAPNHAGWAGHSFDPKTQKCLWDRIRAYHYTVFFVAVVMLAPFATILFCYYRIFAHIHRSKKRLIKTQV